MGMSIPYLETGRSRQKMRTRDAMVAATRALLSEGAVSPSVEQVADRAQVSRTTAYRYFPNQHALLLATYPNFDAQSLLGKHPPRGVVERLDLVTEDILRQVIEREPEFRAMLRLSLERPPGSRDALPLRQGRAIAWIEEALAPLRDELSAKQVRRLALSIRATIGIESMVWLTDMGGLSRTQAAGLMRSSARAILRCALLDAGISA
jgi:AcrR family transcriptional regulator